MVRTPTATVTDLGTEFGVEVDQQGVHHLARVPRLGQGASGFRRRSAGRRAEVLHENQSARVEGARRAGRVIVLVPSAKPADFVREIPRQTIKTLDLVDVVAGGDGFSGRRDAGIDPRNGRPTNVWPKETSASRRWKIPSCGRDAVCGWSLHSLQRRRSGATRFRRPYASLGFPRPKTRHPALSGLARNGTSARSWTASTTPRRAMRVLGLDANKGITFDLEAIRRANPDWKLVRFRAMGGNTEPKSEQGEAVWADLWVFVDGQVRFQRREINRYSGGLPAVVPIKDGERFLTLVATDGGNTIWYDHTMFGDPRLEMVPAKATAGSTPPREAAKH